MILLNMVSNTYSGGSDLSSNDASSNSSSDDDISE